MRAMKSLAALLATSLFAATAWAADAPAAPKVDLAKGAASYATVCVACHAADGNSTVPLQPNLAQQHPEYTLKQLNEFKAGTRQDPIMQGFAAMLTEDDARNIALFEEEGIENDICACGESKLGQDDAVQCAYGVQSACRKLSGRDGGAEDGGDSRG